MYGTSRYRSTAILLYSIPSAFAGTFSGLFRNLKVLWPPQPPTRVHVVSTDAKGCQELPHNTMVALEPDVWVRSVMTAAFTAVRSGGGGG